MVYVKEELFTIKEPSIFTFPLKVEFPPTFKLSFKDMSPVVTIKLLFNDVISLTFKVEIFTIVFKLISLSTLKFPSTIKFPLVVTFPLKVELPPTSKYPLISTFEFKDTSPLVIKE